VLSSLQVSVTPYGPEIRCHLQLPESPDCSC